MLCQDLIYFNYKFHLNRFSPCGRDTETIFDLHNISAIKINDTKKDGSKEPTVIREIDELIPQKSLTLGQNEALPNSVSSERH